MSLPYEGDSSDPAVPGMTGRNSAGGIGVQGQSTGGVAGFFDGDVGVTRNLTVQNVLLTGGGVQLTAPPSGDGVLLSKGDGTNCGNVEIRANQVTCASQISVGSTPNPGAVVVNDSRGNAGVKLDGGTLGGSISVAGSATIGDTLSVTGKVSALGDLTVAGKLTAASFAGDGAGLNNVAPKDSSITSAKLNSLTDQVQALTQQLQTLQDGQNLLKGDLDRRVEQLNARIDQQKKSFEELKQALSDLETKSAPHKVSLLFTPALDGNWVGGRQATMTRLFLSLNYLVFKCPSS